MDEETIILILGVIIGIANGIIVNINKPILAETVFFFSLSGGLIYQIATGKIMNYFQDAVEAIFELFFVGLVDILVVSIFPMIITGLLIKLII